MKPLALLLPMAMILIPACSPLEVGFCLAEQGGGPSLPRSAALAYAVVTRAIRHVNTRDCALLADDCESLLRLPGGSHVSLAGQITDPRSTDQAAGPLVAVISCAEGQRGGHYAFAAGALVSPHAEAAAVIGTSYKMPVLSYAASAAHLGNKGMYPFFGRTSYSSAVVGQQYVELYRHFGWKQALANFTCVSQGAILTEDTPWGHSYAATIVARARAYNITMESVTIVPAGTAADVANMLADPYSAEGEVFRKSCRKAIEFISTRNIHVVNTAFNTEKAVLFARSAEIEGLDIRSIVWSHGDIPELKTLSAALNDPGDMAGKIQGHPGLLHGIISLEHTLLGDSQDRADRLAESVSDFRPEELLPLLYGPGEVAGNGTSPSFPFPLGNLSLAEDSVPAWAMNAYDMVWAAAAAYAEAVRSNNPARFVHEDGLVSVPSGESVMQALPRVSFQGLSGPVSFDANGDRSAADHRLAVTNLVWDNSTGTYTAEQVGTISIDGGRSVVHLNGEGRSPNLAWPGWTYYPEIPVFGKVNVEPPPLPSGLTVSEIASIVAAVGALVAALGGCFVLRNKRPGNHKSAKRRKGPPQQGEPVTLVITDIQGSTALWENFPEEMAAAIVPHHEAARARLRKFQGYEIATEGDSFKCAFHTPDDALCWSINFQLDLLSAPWPLALEDGGQEVLKHRADWANCDDLPALGTRHQEILHDLSSMDKLATLRRDLLASGSLQDTVFETHAASDTQYSKAWFSKHGYQLCCFHSSSKKPIPVFRGLRVRIGIHSGTADVVTTNESTKRKMYGGRVMQVAKAVSEAPCGGQIITTGETLAEMDFPAVKRKVAAACSGWFAGTDVEDSSLPAAVSVISLGSHVILSEAAPDTLVHKRLSYASSVSLSKPPNCKSSTAALDLKTLLSRFLGMSSREDHAVPTHARSLDRGQIKASSYRRSVDTRSAYPGEASSFMPFILPPTNQVATGLRDMDSWAVPEDAESNDASPDLDTGSVAVVDSTPGSHELVMVLPWPLHARARYFPPPTARQKVSLSWHEAPSPNGVTIVFTNVENYSKTKISEEQTGGGEMFAGAVRLLQQVVRSELLQHNGYEVEGEEVNFVLAFGSPVEAVSFAAAVQVSLVHARWSSEVLDTIWGCEYRSSAGRVAFRGMRLAIGMCTGDAVRAHPCERTGRMEYFGPLMNHAARVSMVARGGQVLIHQDTWKVLVEMRKDDSDILENILFRNMGKHALKGIKKSVYIIQAVSKSLESQHYVPLRMTLDRKEELAATPSERTLQNTFENICYGI